MDDDFIVTAYCIISDTLDKSGHQTHKLARVSDAEVLTVAVVAAKFFGNHQERALCLMVKTGTIGPLSVSRYNRRLHALSSWLESSLTILTHVFTQQQVFIIDSIPLPVCKRVRARRCKKVRGKVFCGYCAPKKEKFFGQVSITDASAMRLTCGVCISSVMQGVVPVSYSLVKASYHDLTPLHELSYALPQGATLYGDKAYLSAPDEMSLQEVCGVVLVTPKRKNMKEQNTLSEIFGLQRYRLGIETMNSQLEGMGVQRLRARTNQGFFIKVHASLFALACTNLHELD